jgi:hypothetical protein
MSNSIKLRFKAGAIVLGLFLPISAKGQTSVEPKKVDFCDVVASPDDYDHKLLSTEVILQSSPHSLFLYSASCPSKEGFDVTTQAFLPDGWDSLPVGKKLSKIMKHGRPAKVQLVGIFRSSVYRGPDGQRFRFIISQIYSASKVSDGETRGRNPGTDGTFSDFWTNRRVAQA